jgi:hypothetical protein
MKNSNLQSGRKNQKLKTRDRIIESAHELLNSGAELNMDEIAKKAGISRATVYRYFSSPELLATQLNLILNVPEPKETAASVSGLPLDDGLLNVQNQFLDFILKTENSSRTFLSAFLSMTSPELKRGQHRIKTVQEFLKDDKNNLDNKTKDRLIHIAVLLMGIEAIIVMKDVCGLNENESRNTLTWGLEMILKGMVANKD